MKKLNKQTIAQVITLVAMDYITKGELIDCYNIIYDTYWISGSVSKYIVWLGCK